MAAPLLYLSVPKTVDMNCVKDLIKSYESNTVEFDYWLRETNYDNNWMKDCDGIVIFHPTNNFNFCADELPSGVNKELIQAIHNQIPVYTAYRRLSDDVWGIYDTKLINPRSISALEIHSTARRNSFPKKKKEQSTKEKLYDLENKVREMDARPEIAVSAQSNIILLYGA